MKENFLNEVMEKFLRGAAANEGAFSFTVDSPRSNLCKYQYCFMQEKIGKGRLFYMQQRRLYPKDFNGNARLDPLGAYRLAFVIFEDSICYMMHAGEFEFTIRHPSDDDKLPENVRFFQNELEKQVKYAIFHWLPAFLKEIPSNPPQEEPEGSGMKEVMNAAREILFSGKTEFDLCKQAYDFYEQVTEGRLPSYAIRTVLSDRDFLESICGIVDLKETVFHNLTEEKTFWANNKGFAEAVNELIQSGKAAEVWELRLAEAIRSVNAKTLMVTFAFQGNTGVERMCSNTILSSLTDRRYLHASDFNANGEQFIACLNPDAKTTHQLNNYLTCQNIKTITYKGKVIYEKDESK